MVFGRFPVGRAIRYIFFACSGQKRMSLLSLTRHLKGLRGSMNLFHTVESYTQRHQGINDLREFNSWLSPCD